MLYAWLTYVCLWSAPSLQPFWIPSPTLHMCAPFVGSISASLQFGIHASNDAGRWEHTYAHTCRWRCQPDECMGVLGVSTAFHPRYSMPQVHVQSWNDHNGWAFMGAYCADCASSISKQCWWVVPYVSIHRQHSRSVSLSYHAVNAFGKMDHRCHSLFEAVTKAAIWRDRNKMDHHSHSKFEAVAKAAISLQDESSQSRTVSGSRQGSMGHKLAGSMCEKDAMA